MSDLCIECNDTVRGKQHAITCDVCDRWQHRTCNTGISRTDYFKARKRLIVLNFTCEDCTVTDEAANSESPDESITESADETVQDVSTDNVAMHSTLVEPSNDSVTDSVDETADSISTAGINSAANFTLIELRDEAVRNVHAPAGNIVDEKLVNVFQRTDFNIPTPAALMRVVNRSRQKIRPEDPTSLDFEVNTEYLNDEFYIGDVKVGDERHLLFATPDQMKLLQQAKRWYMDGTFRVINKPFSQLFSIHAFLKQGDTMKQVPLLYAMMSKRRKQDYIAIFQKILAVLDEAPLVEGFVMDFEAGLWMALRDVFPGTQLKGCNFHWAQAVLRKVQEVGLKATYERREGVHNLIRKVLALPFLPGVQIRRAFDKLKEKAEASSEPMRILFQYIEDQWMESSLWSETEWSVYRQTVRTNNDVEGWHRRLNHKAGRASLQFYVLLGVLLTESKLVVRTMQLVSESALRRNRREIYVAIDGKIGELWDKYDAHDIVCEDFLKEIAKVYAFKV